MEPIPYNELSNANLLALAVWREARGEPYLGKRGVAHVVLNRIKDPGWWGHNVQSVILKPWQFSSFNSADPNNQKWPAENDPSWLESIDAAKAVLIDGDSDVTSGAVFYFSPPVTEPPRDWGAVEQTVKIGALSFYKQVSPPMGVNESARV